MISGSSSRRAGRTDRCGSSGTTGRRGGRWPGTSSGRRSSSGAIRMPTWSWATRSWGSGTLICSSSRAGSSPPTWGAVRVCTGRGALTYGEFTAPPRADTPTQLAGPISGLGPDWSSVGPLPPALIDGPGTLLLEATPRPLLEGEGPSPDMASSPFGQALILLIRLLGDIHRDHLKLVREELAQIRRINLEMKATGGAGQPRPRPRPRPRDRHQGGDGRGRRGERRSRAGASGPAPAPRGP